MPTITFIDPAGRRHTVEAPVGKTLMQVAVDHQMPGVAGDCGGCCSCATCHAYVPSPWAEQLAPPEEDEDMMLEGVVDRRPSSRLTCQIAIVDALDGLIVELPAVAG